MAISTSLTESPTNPQRDDPDNFRVDADSYVNWHTQYFVPEMNTVIDDLNSTIQNLFVGTSTTSNVVGTGSKTWTMIEDNLAFGIGNSLRIADTSDPTTNYMSGVITTYNKTTKALTVTVDTSTGSGTKTTWTMALEPPDEYNRVKVWSSMTGAASVPLIVEHDSAYWRLDSNLADVTAKEPGVDAEWTKIGLLSGYEEITTSNPAWAKNPKASWIMVELINGGNSGQARINTSSGLAAYGGAGGISARKLFRAEDVAATVAVVVGAGGEPVVETGSASSSTDGDIGGVSSFGDFTLFASKSGITHDYTYVALQVPDADRFYYGNFNGGDGGGSTGVGVYTGGKCVIGGGGGGNALSSSAGGESVEHGDGGSGVTAVDSDVTATSGAAPGGGGGGASSTSITTTRTATSGAGARGAVRIWQW